MTLAFQNPPQQHFKVLKNSNSLFASTAPITWGPHVPMPTCLSDPLAYWEVRSWRRPLRLCFFASPNWLRSSPLGPNEAQNQSLPSRIFCSLLMFQISFIASPYTFFIPRLSQVAISRFKIIFIFAVQFQMWQSLFQLLHSVLPLRMVPLSVFRWRRNYQDMPCHWLWHRIFSPTTSWSPKYQRSEENESGSSVTIIFITTPAYPRSILFYDPLRGQDYLEV